MRVSIEKNRPVTTIILDRPEALNPNLLLGRFPVTPWLVVWRWRGVESLSVDRFGGAAQFAEGKGRHGVFDK